MAGVSGPSLVTTIQTEIERARQDLKGVDENLRRLTGRDFNDPSQRTDQRRVRLTSGNRDDEPPAKRRPPGGVFARLGAVVLDQPHPDPRGRPRGDMRNELRGDHRGGGERGDPHPELRTEVHAEVRGRRVQEVTDPEEKLPKPSLASSVARPLPDGKSRSEAAAELTKDRASRDRNRRMFGALLGTLKRFKNDEAKQKDKEEQRAAIERKLEEKGRAEKEELRRERLELFNQRKERQAQIRRLTIKMARVKEHEVWEAHQMKLAKFIRTESSPAVFWVPRQHNTRTTALVRTTHDKITRELEQDRLRMKEELDEILGSRHEDREGAEVGEEEETFVHRGVRSQVAKQGEGGGSDPLDNCPDLLDYEAEEGELVYDEADLSGKDDNDDTERMVVQVDGRGEGGRKVEIVASQPEEGGEEGKSGAGLGNDSEKENEGRHKDKDRNREEKNKERERKNRDRGKEKDRRKDKDGEAHKGKDRSTGKEKERGTPRDSEREKRREGAKSKDSSEALESESDLSTTVVHIKIEKEDDTGTRETRPILKIIKEEKLDKAPVAGKKGESTETVPVTADVAIADSLSLGDIEVPTSIAPAEITHSPTVNVQPPTTPSSIPSPPSPHTPPFSPPHPFNSQPPTGATKAGTEADGGTGSEVDAVVIEDDSMGDDAGNSGMASPEPPRERQQDPPDSTKASVEQASVSKEISSIKLPVKGKLQKEEKHKIIRDRIKKRTDRIKDKSRTRRKSGSSDDESSSGSSDSSTDSSDSETSDSDSSSSSSTDSGSTSDSESDSSFTSTSRSDSDSGHEKKKGRRRKGRRSRSDDSSSDSEEEGKTKRRLKSVEKSKERREGGKILKSKGKEEVHSDANKTKKEVGKKDRSREGRKGKEKEEHHKSKEADRIKERDLEHRKDRDLAKKGSRGNSREKRDRSRERRKDRSRSREDRRGGRKDRR